MTRPAALDFGRARIGVAIADELGLLAHPRPFIPGADVLRAIGQIGELVVREQVTLLLVGLPMNLDGTEGPSARRVRHFVERLKARVPVPVELVDERWSTVEASERLREGGTDAKRGRGRVDSAAAAVLLQAWLDARPAQGAL